MAQRQKRFEADPLTSGVTPNRQTVAMTADPKSRTDELRHQLNTTTTATESFRIPR